MSDQAKVDEARTKANEARFKADKARARADNAQFKANEARAKVDEARFNADEARAKADEVHAKADEAQARADEVHAKADEVQARADEARLRADHSRGSINQARQSFGSILNYYLYNRETIENVPDWVDSPESGVIIIGLSPTAAPSAEKTESYKEHLRGLLAAEKNFKDLPDEERDLMIQAANSSKVRRKEQK